MHRVLVLGAGKIGSLVACLLEEGGDYEVHLGDVSLEAPKQLIEALSLSRVTPVLLDVRHADAVSAYLAAHRFEAVLSSLPYFCNPTVAGAQLLLVSLYCKSKVPATPIALTLLVTSPPAFISVAVLKPASTVALKALLI